ncbi:hypothetical protein ACC848_37875, partial [Rhizobium johnstonii]
ASGAVAATAMTGAAHAAAFKTVRRLADFADKDEIMLSVMSVPPRNRDGNEADSILTGANTGDFATAPPASHRV